MLNYFERKLVYYTTLLSELLPGKRYEEVFDALSPIFYISDDARLNSVLAHPTFQKLDSSRAINMQMNYVQSFCSDDAEFGKSPDELGALEMRFDAISLVEELSKDATKPDPLAVLCELQKEKGVCGAAVVLSLYVRGYFDNQSRAMLGKALKKGDLDAGIVAFYFAAGEAYRQQICSEILKMPESRLYPEIDDTLSAHLAENPEQKTIPEGGM